MANNAENRSIWWRHHEPHKHTKLSAPWIRLCNWPKYPLTGGDRVLRNNQLVYPRFVWLTGDSHVIPQLEQLPYCCGSVLKRDCIITHVKSWVNGGFFFLHDAFSTRYYFEHCNANTEQIALRYIHIYATGARWWWVIIVWGNDFVPSGTKPLPETKLTSGLFYQGS